MFALGPRGLPGAARPANLLEQRAEVDVARRGDRDRVARVAVLEVAAHRVDRKLRDRLGGAEHAEAERVIAEVALAGLLHQHPVGLVGVHRDLFEDDAALLLEVRGAKRRTQDVRKHLGAREDRLRQARGVVDGHLVARERIVVEAEIVELGAHLDRAAAFAALEDHVLEEVADAPSPRGVRLGCRCGRRSRPPRSRRRDRSRRGR